MTVNAIAYARDKLGKLVAFKINDAVSYEGAIEAVKADLGVDRALCLVPNKQPELPVFKLKKEAVNE